MSLPIVLRSEASRDAEEARDYYNAREAGLGQLFLRRLAECLARVQANPELYGCEWGEVRATRVRKFPYVVYYRILEIHVEVMAVMHGSRDPVAWQSRA